MGTHWGAGAWVAAGLLLVGAAQAQTLPQWHLAGQLEMSPGEVIGPLNVSPMGELVAGMAWDQTAGFTGRVWTLQDGLQVSELATPFAALLEIRFTQSPYDLNTLAASVYAQSRRALRSWSILDGALIHSFEFDSDILATDALYDPHRDTFIVSQEFGSLLVYSATGAVIGAVEVDAMRRHGGLLLSYDGGLLVVDSGAFTLSTVMTGLPRSCADVDCAEAYQALPGSYGPYEALLAFDPQGGRVATLPEVNPERAGLQDGPFRAVDAPTIRIWDDILAWTSTAEPDLEIAGFGSAPVWGQFSADGTRLLTLEEAGHLAIWDAASGQQVFRLTATDGDGIVAARFIPNSKSLFVHWASGVSRIVDMGQGATILELPRPNADVVVSPDGRTLITYAIGEAPARVWRRR